jgi:hypothetical protein
MTEVVVANISRENEKKLQTCAQQIEVLSKATTDMLKDTKTS